MRIVLAFIMLALSVICLFSFIIRVDRVSGESMYPYLSNGDWIIYGRLGGRCNRDEVVVFENGGENFVKRIVGLPGDTVEISVSGDRMVVSETQVREHYITLAVPERENGGNEIGAPLAVAEGQHLVLGNNRRVSIDSHGQNVGTVTSKQILGNVILIIRARG